MATVTVTRTTTLFHDVDNDGKADPGDTLRTHILITNPATNPVTGILVSDPANGTTIQPGTVTITPIAADDAYALVGNTPISFAANAGVLANDFDADSSTPNSNVGVTVSQVNGTAISGSPIAVSNGSVLMAADGSFTFTPATGFIGTTSFQYQVTDASGLHAVDTGVVTLTVGADVWYVDGNSATNGDGSYANPFNTLTSVNGVDHAGDTVVVHNTLSAGGLIMEANETLYGDGSTFIANGHQITNNGANSTINHAAVGVTLATDNVINGVNFVGTATGAIGIQDGGTSVSTATHNLAITHTAITGQGQIIDINLGGKVVASLDSIASTGSTGANGGVVDLSGLTTGSSVTVVGTTSITGTHAQAGINISGNAGTTVDFQGAVTINTGAQNALNVTGNTGTDSISFDAGTKTITTTTGAAVNLSGNTTATTVNFTGGGLNINTTSGVGLNLGATTLNVTGASNTIATTTGQIITASSASVGTSGVAFTSLASTGAVAGHAVSINNLDGNSFSGGTVSIASTTGNDADTTASDGIHIAGGSTTNFTFGSTTIGGTLSVAGDGVDLSGANGTVSFSSVAINNIVGNGVSINGATQAVTISGGTIGDTNDPGADAVNIAGGTGAVTINAAITKATAGNAVDISGHNSLGSGLGTIAFNGDITSNGTSNGITIDNNVGGAINFTGTNVTLNTGASTALNFTNNQATGAAVTFNGGNLNIDTTSGTGINATSTTGGAPIGSLAISGFNNTVDTTAGGTAVKVLGVGETIELLHVSAAGGSNTAISLDNAGTAGGNYFIVDGTGTTAGSGGVLNFTAGGADNATSAGIGVYLHNVGNVTLQDMNFTGTFSNFGIRGDTVNNFTLKDSNLTGTFGTSTGLDEGTIRFGTQAGSTNGLTGAASFLGNNIAGTTIEDGVAIYENVAGSASVNFADTTANQAIIGGTVPNDGIHLESNGTFTLVTTIDGLDFNGAHGDLLQVVAGGSTAQNLTIQNNNFHNANATSVGGGLTLGGGGSSSNYNVTFNVNNNNFKGAEGTALGALYLGQAATVSGIILNNVIGTPNGVLDSGIASRGSNSGNGIEIRSEHIAGGGTLNESYRIEGNQVSDIGGTAGIAIRSSSQNGGGTSHVEATVLNNVVKNFGANATAAFYSNVGGFGDGPPADNATLGLNVIGNTFDSTGATSGQNNAMVLDQTSGSAHYYLPGYAGSPNGELQVYGAAGTASTAITSFMLDATHHNSLTNNPTGPKNVPNLVDASLVFGVTGAAFSSTVPEFAAQAPMQTWEQQALQDKPVDQPQVTTTGEQNGAGTPGGIAPAGDGAGAAGSTPPADMPPPPPPPAVVDNSVLTQSELDFTVSAAIARWAEAGASAAQIAAMKAVSVTIADIAGIQIGGATAGHIMIDSDGAGFGWFLDSTPDGDSEFHGTGSDLLANAGGPAAGKLDLLTVVMHELGHQIGLDDQYQPGQTADVMYGYANPGERRLPTGADVQAASGTAIDHEAFSLSPIAAGSLPVNKAVEVSFDSTVNAFPSNAFVPTFTSTAHVTYTGNSTGVDSNTETLSATSSPLALDSLTLGDTVFNDANTNGHFDAGEGVSAVALSLFAKGTVAGGNTGVNDTDVDGDGIADKYLGATTSGALGAYNFTGLAQGDYIVRVDAVNFTAAHPLFGLTPSTPVDTTPNDDLDNDSNAVDRGSGVIASNAITLSFGGEPSGTGNDVNNTLDLGFIANQPPVVTTTGGTTAFVEGSNTPSTPVVVDSGVTVTDSDNATLASATVKITGNLHNAEDVLAFTNNNATTFGNISASYNSTTGVLTLTSSGATATKAQFQAALEAVTYNDTSDTPNTATRTITFTANDSHVDSSPATHSVSVTAVNDSPTGANATLSTNEDISHTFVASDFGYSDVDGNALNAVIVNSFTGGAVKLNGVAVSNGQSVLASEIAAGHLVFAPTANLNGAGAGSVNFNLQDNGGTANGGHDTSVSANTITFDIASVNDAPSGADNTKSIAEDTPYTFAASDFGFTDPVEGDSFQAVKITTLPTGGTLTLGGNPVAAGDVVPVAQIGTLVFTPTQDLNGTGAGHFTFQVQDNGGTANGGVDTDPTPNTFTFDISAVNDAPVNHVPGPVSVNEDTSLAFTGGNAISVSDVDAGTGTVTVDLGVLHGTLALTGSGAAAVTGSGTEAAHVSGTLTDVNATLASLSYKGVADYHGADTLTVGTSDNGNSGSGGAGTDSDTVAITVNSVNDAPSGADITQAIAEDAPYTFAASDFGFTDPADGDALQAVKITTLPTGGTLTLGGNPVAAGEVVPVGQIGTLVFTPTQDLNGTGAGHFTFQVQDNGGTANGGVDTDPTPNTFTFDISAVNDAPVNHVPGPVSVNEDTSLAFTGGNAISVSDVDAGTGTVTVDLGVLHGTLALTASGAAAVTGSGTGAAHVSGTLTDVNATLASLSYKGVANYQGADTLTVGTSDNGNSGSGGAGTDSDTVAITVNPINDAPVLSASPPVTTDEQTAVTLDPALSVHDVDLDAFNGGAGDYAGAKLSVANNSGTTTADDHFTIANGMDFHVSGSQLLDSANHEFATFSGGNGTPLVITFTSAATPATTALVNEVAQHLQYTNGSDTPPGSIDVSVSLNDGDFTSGNQGTEPTPSFLDSIGSDVVTVNLTPVNDPPVVDLNGAAPGTSSSINFTEGDPATTLAPSATVTDADLPTNFGGGTLTVSFTANGTLDDMLVVIDQSAAHGHITTDESSLYYDGNFIGSYYGGGDGSTPLAVTFTADATPAMVQAVVEDIGFANGSGAPSTLDRTVTFSLTDGQGGTSDPVTATVHLTAIDTPGIATDDFASTPENAPVVINVMANDQDPDGGPASNISAIDGMPIAVGGHVTLASGATVTLNSDGTLTYDPNGKFNTLTSPSGGESGAVNTQADENFTYTLSGGGSGTANVKVTVVGVASPDDRLQGDSNDNVITGTPGPDFFELQQGGNDTVSGLGGNDIFYFGSALTVADKVDGGPGADQIALQGNYPGLTLGTQVINVESLYLMAGSDTRLGDTAGNFYSYNITTVDQNIAAGQQLTIDGSALRPGENLTINASAETDGNVWIYGGAGVDTLTGGAKNDVFLFGEGRFGASDHVDGGAGIDQLALRGNYNVTFGATQMTSIESLYLMSAADTRVGVAGTTFSYNLTMNDGNVAAGQQLTVDAAALRPNETLTFNGSAETNGTFRIFGGQGNDHIVGGQGNDILTGGLGADYLKGGPGADIYNFRSAAESTSTSYDVIDGFDPSADRIDFPGIVAGWSPTMSHGQLNNATFDADLAAALDGTLNPNTAMLFTPTIGDNAGKTFLIFDADGDGNYTAGHDYVIQIINPAHPITTTDTHFFI